MNTQITFSQWATRRVSALGVAGALLFLTELADVLTNTGTPGAAAAPKVKSTLTRWRVHCITDMVARLSVSFYEQPQGKGAPLSSQDETEWRVRETPIRPGSVQALLKKEVCQ